MLDKDLAASISANITKELQQIRQMQDAAERRLKEEVGRKEQETHAIFEKLMRMHDAAQQEREQAEEARKERHKFWTKFVLGPSGALAVIVGAVLGYFQLQKPVPPSPQEQAERVEQAQQAMTRTVEDRVRDVEQSLAKNDEKIKRTVEMLMTQQVQLSESTDFIIGKIEKAHPQTRSMQEPAAVTEGRAAADAIKRRRDRAKYNPADPLAGLE